MQLFSSKISMYKIYLCYMELEQNKQIKSVNILNFNISLTFWYYVMQSSEKYPTPSY